MAACEPAARPAADAALPGRPAAARDRLAREEVTTMRIETLLVALGALAPLPAAAAGASSSGPVRGLYVEARTASVFAGACHYGSEYTTAGREALLAWTIEEGLVDGVSLAGLEAVVAVAGDGNLDARSTRRRSVVYLPEAADERRRGALFAWLVREHGSLLGDLRSIRVVPLEVTIERSEPGAFRVRAGRYASLEGSRIPDRACCAMPQKVWYRPFTRVTARVVGRADGFRGNDPALGPPWHELDRNCAFLGVFGRPDELTREEIAHI